jgi:hypothetical protein
MAELYPVLVEALRWGGHVTFTATGVSMLPMLRHMRDTVTLRPARGDARVGDVALYRRENGQFVLHRIVGVEENGDYVFCGDNQFIRERFVSPRQVIALMASLSRHGHVYRCDSFLYRMYVFLLPLLRLMRRVFLAVLRRLGKLRRMGIKWRGTAKASKKDSQQVRAEQFRDCHAERSSAECRGGDRRAL